MLKVDVTVDFPSEDEFVKWFNSQTDELYLEMAEAHAKYAKQLVHDVTGNLGKHIHAKKSKFEDGGAISLCDANHAHLVEFGTSEPRLPKEKKLMKFEADGETKFAKVVAPMPAKPFMRPAKEKVIAEYSRKLRSK